MNSIRDDQRKLQKAARLAYKLRMNLFHEAGPTLETRPKRGGHAFRKRRSLREN